MDESTNLAARAHSRAAPAPDRAFHGRTVAPAALASAVLGLLGLIWCAIVLGPAAIFLSDRAGKLIASDPRYEGSLYAGAGRVLGIASLVLLAFGFPVESLG